MMNQDSGLWLFQGVGQGDRVGVLKQTQLGIEVIIVAV